jgi:YD repeat-containing protein
MICFASCAAGRLQTIDYPSDADHRFVYSAAGERIEAVEW